jgi:hypothetical protein
MMKTHSVQVALVNVDNSPALVQQIHEVESMLLPQNFALVTIRIYSCILNLTIAHLGNSTKHILRS